MYILETQFKTVATLIGDPVRATIMWALLDGRAFTATELAITARTSPQNISMHLAKLVQAGLISVEKQGRHRYYRFSRKEIAYCIEAMANLIPFDRREKNTTPGNSSPVQYCRTCYDHLAGKVGVMITDSLLAQKIITLKDDLFKVSPKGRNWFTQLGIDMDELEQRRRFLIKPCLDWSERRHHMAGALPAMLLDNMLSAGWLRKITHSRAVTITGNGHREFYRYFGIGV
jgi:DNA-binding transcriptional ArsR family regulator